MPKRPGKKAQDRVGDQSRGKLPGAPSDSRRQDSETIKDALRGDQAAYQKLMRKYHDAIYMLIYRMVREKAEVEDLTQEAFIKAFASLGNFNNEYAFSTWLYKIATNNCIDYIRRKKLQPFSLDKPVDSDQDQYTFEVPDTSFEADKPIIERQRAKFLEEAIDALPEKYRRVIILRHKEERDYREIAKMLHLPLGTVKAHLFRARELLKKYLRNKIQQF
ncbi:MAG: sigma-70 family RNA polymerase sigma factor [Bacteroidota bacterium]